MEPYDPTLEALVEAMIEALAPDADKAQGYVDNLRCLDITLTQILTDPESHTASPETEQTLRQALGHLDAKAGDAELEYLQVVGRVRSAVEKELFKWGSSMVQPAGLSGDSQVPVSGGEWEAHTEALPELSRQRLTV
jgi:hypothetical protein